MLLFTNRYRDFKPSEGVPVRITFSAPRYRLPYDLEYKCSLLIPGRWFLEGTDEEFTQRYERVPHDRNPKNTFASR